MLSSLSTRSYYWDQSIEAKSINFPTLLSKNWNQISPCLTGVCCRFASANFLLHLHTQVQFVIPNTSLGSILQHFQGITPNQDHFSLIEAPWHAFIETDFIETFIKDGNGLLYHLELVSLQGTLGKELYFGKEL